MRLNSDVRWATRDSEKVFAMPRHSCSWLLKAARRSRPGKISRLSQEKEHVCTLYILGAERSENMHGSRRKTARVHCVVFVYIMRDRALRTNRVHVLLKEQTKATRTRGEIACAQHLEQSNGRLRALGNAVRVTEPRVSQGLFLLVADVDRLLEKKEFSYSSYAVVDAYS